MDRPTEQISWPTDLQSSCVMELVPTDHPTFVIYGFFRAVRVAYADVRFPRAVSVREAPACASAQELPASYALLPVDFGAVCESGNRRVSSNQPGFRIRNRHNRIQRKDHELCVVSDEELAWT